MNKVISLILRTFFVLFILFGINFNIHTQIISTAIIKVDSVQIGDTVSVDIKVTIPSGVTLQSLDFSGYRSIENQLYNNDTIYLDKYADVEILNFGHWKHTDMGTPIPASTVKIINNDGQQTITNRITIAIYNMGVFSIPGPVVVNNENAAILPSESAMIKVFLPEKMMKQDTIAFNPIKDIMTEEADISDYLIYLYILIAIGLMAAIGYYFYKLKKKKEEEIISVIPDPILPAHEKALLALKSLSNQALWQRGYIKEYQSGLTDIIRTYLEERYGIKAPEMTTDEISEALKNADFDKMYISDLKEILQIADLVKFAKATPQDDIHSIFMDRAVEFIKNTKEADILS